MGNQARPIISQIVIDEFTKIIDNQDEKGLEKYRKTIDDAADEEYSWQIMALEETADLQKYLVKQIQMLKKQNLELRFSQRRQLLVKVLQENLEFSEAFSDLDARTINNLCKQAYETAKSKGWHDEERETGTLLALIHSEVSEALEADRKGLGTFAEELADICIRVFDLCGARGIDLEAAILQKMEFNKTRPHMHGGKKY